MCRGLSPGWCNVGVWTEQPAGGKVGSLPAQYISFHRECQRGVFFATFRLYNRILSINLECTGAHSHNLEVPMEEQAPAAPTISFSDIVMNIFASPSEAFEGIRTSPARASVWVIPMILILLLSSASIWIVFSNDTLRGQALEAQKQKIEEQARTGQIPQERADQALQSMEKGGGMMAAIGIVFSSITLIILFFLTALVYWLVGKFALKAEGGYGKYLELWGALQWIGLLGGIVTLLMIVAMNSVYASPSAALGVMANYNRLDTTHRLLSSLNIFTIWEMIVLGLGLSKFSGKSMGVGIGVAMGLWVAWVLLSVFALGSLGM
jgi:hypothetical protein